MPSWIRIRIRNLYADPDPDPAAEINADPCGSGYGSETLLKCKEIQMGVIYMRKGSLIYEEMRKYLVILFMRRLWRMAENPPS